MLGLKLVEGAQLDSGVADRLDELALKFQNFVSDLPASYPVEAYLGLCNDLRGVLRHTFVLDDVDSELLSGSYWRLLAMSGAGYDSSVVRDVLRAESGELVRRLAARSDSVRAATRRWSNAGEVLVPDTNVWLHEVGREAIDEYPWRDLTGRRANAPTTVVLLGVVVDELDRWKRKGDNDRRAAARSVLKQVDSLFPDGEGAVAQLKPPVQLAVTVEDDFRERRLEDADREIIERTIELTAMVPEADVTFVSGDSAAVFRAREAGLRCTKVATPAP